MAYPKFSRPAPAPGGAVPAAGFDPQYIDVYRRLTQFFEEWDAKYRAAAAAVDATPQGDKWLAANTQLVALADGLMKFKSIEYLEATLAAIYAALE